MCRLAEVSPSGFYAWHKRSMLSRHAARDVELAARIREIFTEHRSRYGAPRVHQQLEREGYRTSRKRVARLMRVRQLRARRARRFVRTTQSVHAWPAAANVLNRRFDASKPNEAWVGDITYLRTREGWLYLAVLIDLYSRAIVGWATGATLERGLCIDALHAALKQHRPGPGLLHHTDRGVQYASDDYRSLLHQHGLEASMSRVGNCWDNAVAESFFATMKVELGEEIEDKSGAQIRPILFAYIEGYYNTLRLHSSLGYRTPREALLDHGMTTHRT